MTMLMREKEKYDEGVEWGMEKGMKEIVFKMYQNNFTIEQIAMATGKNEEEIEEILDRNKVLV